MTTFRFWHRMEAILDYNKAKQVAIQPKFD